MGKCLSGLQLRDTIHKRARNCTRNCTVRVISPRCSGESMEHSHVKVLDRDGCFEVVSPDQLNALLADSAKKPDVHHINAVGEIGNSAYLPILERALQSSDHLV